MKERPKTTGIESTFKSYGLGLCPEIRIAVFKKFLKNNPEFSGNELRNFGIEAALQQCENKDGEPVRCKRIFFPIYDENGQVVNGMLFCPGENIIARKRSRLLLRDVAGIICSVSDAAKLRDGLDSTKHAIFVDRFEDVIALSKESVGFTNTNNFIFSIAGNRNSVFGHEDENGEYDSDPIALRIWNKFYKNDVKPILLGIEDKKLESLHLMSECVDETPFCLPAMIATRSFGTIHEFVSIGGTRLTIHLYANFRGPERSYEDKAVLAKWLYSDLIHNLFGHKSPQKYACADDGSPLRKFDLVPGEPTILGGRAGDGKTALACSLIGEIAQRNDDVGRILYVNTDQLPERLFERELSRITGIPYQDVRWGNLGTLEYQRVMIENEAAIRTIGKKIHYMNSRNLVEIKEETERLKPEILVLDHIQMIGTSSKQTKRQDELRLLMDRVLQIAQTGIAVLLISSLNRTGIQSAAHGPVGVEALCGSSALEYVSANVWMLRPNEKRKKEKGHLVLDTGKPY